MDDADLELDGFSNLIGGAILIGDEPGPGDPTHEPGIDLSGSELEAVEQYEPSFGQFEDGNPSLAGSSFQTTLEHLPCQKRNDKRSPLVYTLANAKEERHPPFQSTGNNTSSLLESEKEPCSYDQENHRYASMQVPSFAKCTETSLQKYQAT